MSKIPGKDVSKCPLWTLIETLVTHTHTQKYTHTHTHTHTYTHTLETHSKGHLPM